MVASENDALVGGKVGGIGDVVRDVPLALVEEGCVVDVITPAYQLFSILPRAQIAASFDIRFAGSTHQVALYQVPPKQPTQGVAHWALELPSAFYVEPKTIYFNDPPSSPFATDATKFACFCAGVASALINGALAKPDVIHLHDWHSSLLLLLRNHAPEFSPLQSIRCVYTIHNLALQGIRPLRDHESALESWFPELPYLPQQITDPRVPHCINLMRTGINLADKVHAVSPSYTQEIMLPSDPERGFIGGEGLHEDLIAAHAKNKIVGILNGCHYREPTPLKPTKQQLVALLNAEILTLISQQAFVDSALYIAQKRVAVWADKTPPCLLMTSVGRITDQKVAILRHTFDSGKSTLESLLDELGQEGILILLGSGDHELEQFLTKISAAYENFIFVKGYSEKLSDALYLSGELFLMPSSFEPCGISQMLAMRAGQPCLVHAVGGLKDSIDNNINGFSFDGVSVQQQSINLIKRFSEVKKLKRSNKQKYKKISDNAYQTRFSWKKSARKYLTDLYEFPG